MRRAAVLSVCLSILLAFGAGFAPTDDLPVPAIRHVLIVSIDGLRPDVLLRADTPFIRRLWKSGSFSFWAKTTPASITLPSHVSMLTGVSPEAHGVMWNADLPLTEPVYPAVPTIFQLAKKAGLTTAMAAGKSKIGVVNTPGAIDYVFTATGKTSGDGDVVGPATEILRQHKPNVMFVHLPGVDNAGHAKGWGSPEQIAAVEAADACVGQLLTTLDQAGLRSSTLILLTADHGGAGRTHGPDDARSRSIPWILSGPSVRPDFDLTLAGGNSEVRTYDTFATACAVLNIPAVPGEGRFVREAFENQELIVSTYKPDMAPSTGPAP